MSAVGDEPSVTCPKTVPDSFSSPFDCLSYGILQSTGHRPQTACPSVVCSGAHQWQGLAPQNQGIDAFLARWYSSE